MTTLGTSTHDVAVGEKRARLFVVVLFGDFFCKKTFLVESQKDLLRSFVMYGFARAMVDIERNAHFVKTITHLCMILVNYRTGGRVLLKGLVRNGRAVLIAAANE